MSVKSVTHLNFRGDAASALHFYQSVFDGELVILSNKDFGGVEDPTEKDQVKWGQVTAPSGFSIMAFDVPARMPWNPGENAYFVSVRGDDSDEIADFWEKLSEGGTILQPLTPAPWSPLFGMLRDRFGISWVLDVATGYEAS